MGHSMTSPTHQDPATTDKYHSWLKMQGTTECPTCKLVLTAQVQEVADQPLPPQESKSPERGLEEKILTVTKTTKDRGFYLTETKTYIKPGSTGTGGTLARTISFYVGNAKLVTYRSESVEEGTLGLISQKRGADISDDPVKISKARAEIILAWVLYLLRQERSKHNPSVEVPKQITLSKGVRDLYRKFVLAEKLRKANAQQINPKEYDEAMTQYLIDEEIEIDASEQERWDSLTKEEQEAELKEMEEQDKLINEIMKETDKQESERES